MLDKKSHGVPRWRLLVEFSGSKLLDDKGNI